MDIPTLPAFALIVGSNRAGPGQQPLSYAVDDAHRVQAVLHELGGYHPTDTVLLDDPHADDLMAALDDLDDRVPDGATFLFYYSGHARAAALNLGPEEIPLDLLRDRLEAMGAQLTLVVLDACQAGAISGIKGAAPAADFSHASVAGLEMAGTAVMASSTARELSQESEDLGGSYFTHHLVTGLRGAADRDRDGQVTLSEAYGYAYHRTLVATAATAIGRQHATLETALAGLGEAVITRPRQASAQLAFPEDLSGELLVADHTSGKVAAELLKSPGSPLTLALPPGPYQVLMRDGAIHARCDVALDEGVVAILHPEDCVEVDPRDERSKGDSRLERVMVELAVGVAGRRDDGFNQTLDDFGFSRSDEQLFTPVFSGAAAWSFLPRLSLVLTVSDLETSAYQRAVKGLDGATVTQDFSWTTWRTALSARGSLPLLDGWLVPYGQVGGGPALGITHYVDHDTDQPERHLGLHLAAAGGLQLMPNIKGWRHLGGFIQIETTSARVVENLVGDVHDSGGAALTLGLRAGG